MMRLFKNGDMFLWLTGAVLAGICFLVAGLLAVVAFHGAGVFWPSPIARVTQQNGQIHLGEISDEESIPGAVDEATGLEGVRWQLKVGNRDVYGSDFRWINESDVTALDYPMNALCIERRANGNMYGFLLSVKNHGAVVATGDYAIPSFRSLLEKARLVQQAIDEIETSVIGSVNDEMEKIRLERQKMDFYGTSNAASNLALDRRLEELQQKYGMARSRIDTLAAEISGLSVVVALAQQEEKELPLAGIVRFTEPNRLSIADRLSHYVTKISEFLTADPRESNTEGGVFPAIFGTVMMVLLMTLAVVPFGVVAALYLKEYARQGLWVRIIRIAVNNLAGVPSIVFGIFGLGFFVYFCGGTIDNLFYPERLPTPTWGTGGILWASLTLALLTVPVVIVATEEALNAVPKGVRDGSMALGATKWQTTWRVILPASTPGILTGVILAMARGAGEVAPLMITGVVKLAPNLPLDASFPFFHLDRKFMHLGFHIYDVGFQSPNVEAAKPMVFMTALLLILLVLLLNLTAIIIRARLRKKYQSSAF